MAVLLIRLAGPMQSWGNQSRFSHRDTGTEPSKSGVVGLLCAAMGIPREDTGSLAKLAGLKMGVRVDRQGIMKEDYHTAQGVVKASGSLPKEGEAVLSHRFYLSDACFLAALQGDNKLLEQVKESLESPVWQLFLGRKSFVPGIPVYLPDGYMPEVDSLEDALKSYPYLIAGENEQGDRELRTIIEAQYEEGDGVRQDQPLSFVSSRRRFTVRHVKTGTVRMEDLPPAKEDSCIYLA